MSEERTLLVDASVFITLAKVGATELLSRRTEEVIVPEQVAGEIRSDPAESRLKEMTETGHLSREQVPAPQLLSAGEHLGKDLSENEVTGYSHLDVEGDIALLGLARSSATIVVTDDKPLRQTCKALSLPVTGSIGIVVHAVEVGDIGSAEAKETLYAMDEVGARLSASLVQRAEQMIEDAAED